MYANSTSLHVVKQHLGYRIEQLGYVKRGPHLTNSGNDLFPLGLLLLLGWLTLEGLAIIWIFSSLFLLLV